MECIGIVFVMQEDHDAIFLSSVLIFSDSERLMTVRRLCIYFPKTTRYNTSCALFRIARMAHSSSAKYALPNSKFISNFPNPCRGMQSLACCTSGGGGGGISPE